MALARITYKWGDAVAEVKADSSVSLGVSFKWEGGKAPATFTRAKLQVVEPFHKDTTRPALPVENVNFKRDPGLDAGDAWWIADVLSLFNVEARSRGIITRTASPDFSFRTTPPDYSQPELITPESSGSTMETVPTQPEG